MGLEENSVCAGGQRAPRQHRREFSLATGLVTAGAGQLDRVSRVKNHRKTKPPHNRNGTHVRDKVVVAESSAALGQQKPLAPGALPLAHYLPHFCRRKKLALFEIHNLAGFDCGGDQIGLAAKKSWNL